MSRVWVTWVLMGAMMLGGLTPSKARGEALRRRVVVLLDTSGSMVGKCGATCIACSTNAQCVLPDKLHIGLTCSGGRCVPVDSGYCRDIWNKVRQLLVQRIGRADQIRDGDHVQLYVFDSAGRHARRIWDRPVTTESRRELMEFILSDRLKADASCTKLYDILQDLMRRIAKESSRFDETDILILTDGFDEGSVFTEEGACRIMKEEAMDRDRMRVRFWRTTEYSYVPDCFCEGNEALYCPCWSDEDEYHDILDNCPFTPGDSNVDTDGDTPTHGCFEQLLCPDGPGTCGGDLCDSDDDGDGDPDETDCAPKDKSKGARNPELCNGVDDNCNGIVDEPWREASSSMDPCVYCPGNDCDGDGIRNEDDNCHRVANEHQEDLDGDCPAKPFAKNPQCGDACDPDLDGDGIENARDRCWRTPDPKQADLDGDCPVPPYDQDPKCGDACDCIRRMKVSVQRPAQPVSIRNRDTDGVIEIADLDGGTTADCGPEPPILRLFTASKDAPLGLSRSLRHQFGEGHRPYLVRWRVNRFPKRREAFIEGTVHLMLAAGTDPIQVQLEGDLLGTDGEATRTIPLWGDKAVPLPIRAPVEVVTLAWEPDAEVLCEAPARDECEVHLGAIDASVLAWETEARGAKLDLRLRLDLSDEPFATARPEEEDIDPDEIGEEAEDGFVKDVTVEIDRRGVALGRLDGTVRWACTGKRDEPLSWRLGVQAVDRNGWLVLEGAVPEMEIQSDCEERSDEDDGGFGWLVWILIPLLLAGAYGAFRWRQYPPTSGLRVVVTREGAAMPPKRLWRDNGLRLCAPITQQDLTALGCPGILRIIMDRQGALDGTFTPAAGDPIHAKMGTVESSSGAFSPLQTLAPEPGVSIALDQAAGVRRRRGDPGGGTKRSSKGRTLGRGSRPSSRTSSS